MMPVLPGVGPVANSDPHDFNPAKVDIGELAERDRPLVSATQQDRRIVRRMNGGGPLTRRVFQRHVERAGAVAFRLFRPDGLNCPLTCDVALNFLDPFTEADLGLPEGIPIGVAKVAGVKQRVYLAPRVRTGYVHVVSYAFTTYFR
jgi:hypothetical protein